MPTLEPAETRRLVLRVLIALILIVGAGALGLWVGKLSVQDDLPDYEPIAGAPGRPAKPAKVNEADLTTPVPPVYFAAGVDTPEDWPVIAGQIKLAEAADVDQIILPLKLDWQSTGNASAALNLIDRATAANPRARIFLNLDLNPDQAWAEDRPTEVVPATADRPPCALPASRFWRDDAATRAAALAKAIIADKRGIHVRGFVLSAMDGGRWLTPPGTTTAPGNTQAFRDWLQKKYTDNEALQRAWGRDTTTLAIAEPPAEPTDTPPGKIFLDLPTQQDVLDYRQYLSEETADAIAAIMVALKEAVPDRKVYANYGHTFEADGAPTGALGMGRLLYGDLDGFVGTITNTERGIGATGAPSAPTFSAILHQKDWILLDDTRTGVSRDPGTGQITRIEGMRFEDVYNVQRRNFTFAAVHGLGIAWTDPLGEGWLHDDPQWTVLGQMRAIYSQLYPILPGGAAAASSENQPEDAAESLPEGQEAAGTDAAPTSFDAQLENMLQPAPVGPPNSFKAELLVVIDEAAMHQLASPALVRERITLPACDAAFRSGAAVRTVLLQDVLDDIAPGAQVYLFVNAFRLTEAERSRLHARLQRDQACAIWCYAPGYLAPTPDTAAVSDTVGMKVQQVKAPAAAGSLFTLGGRWLAEGAEIGDPTPFEPLFSIDDPDADVIAQYKGSPKGSIALRVLPEGWTSIYVAEPTMTPGLLRELLRIIERRSCFKFTGREFYDAANVGLNLVGIHAKQPGEISLSLGNVYDIKDLFDETIGWPQKESVTFPVKTGETRLFKLTPLY